VPRVSSFGAETHPAHNITAEITAMRDICFFIFFLPNRRPGKCFTLIIKRELTLVNKRILMKQYENNHEQIKSIICYNRKKSFPNYYPEKTYYAKTRLERYVEAEAGTTRTAGV
jgi:hypothetical protein